MRTTRERGEPTKFASAYNLRALWRSWIGWTAASWANPYGEAAPMLQADAGLQPTSVAAQHGGMPAIRYDGVDNYQQATFTLAQPWSLFMALDVRTPGQPGSQDCVCDGKTNVTGVVVVTDPGAGNALQVNGGANLVASAATTLVDQSVYCSLWTVFSGASSRVGINQTLLVTGNAGTGTPAGFTMGTLGAGTAGRANAVDAYEIAIYATAVPTDVARRIAARQAAL